MLKIIIISALLLFTPALADIYAASDFSGDGYHSSSSDGPDAKLYSSTTGAMEYSQIFDLEQGKYRTWAGINGSGDISISTPEYDMDIRGAKDLFFTAGLNRQAVISASEYEMEPELSRIKITQNLTHASTVRISARGNGNLSEDIRIGSSTTKSGMLHLWDFDFGPGNFTLNRTLRLSGEESRERFTVLEDPEETIRGDGDT